MSFSTWHQLEAPVHQLDKTGRDTVFSYAQIGAVLMSSLRRAETPEDLLDTGFDMLMRDLRANQSNWRSSEEFIGLTLGTRAFELGLSIDDEASEAFALSRDEIATVRQWEVKGIRMAESLPEASFSEVTLEAAIQNEASDLDQLLGLASGVRRFHVTRDNLKGLIV